MENFLEVRSVPSWIRLLLGIVNTRTLELFMQRLGDPLKGKHKGYTRTGLRRSALKVSYKTCFLWFDEGVGKAYF